MKKFILIGWISCKNKVGQEFTEEEIWKTINYDTLHGWGCWDGSLDDLNKRIGRKAFELIDVQ